MNMNILQKRMDTSDSKVTQISDKDKEQDKILQHTKDDLGKTKGDLGKTNSDLKAFEGTTTTSIRQLNGQISVMEKTLPVGTILALWKLPKGWSENWISCDGQAITKGPFSNMKAPELNKAGRFLRGGPPTSVGSYQSQDTNMSKLQATYLDRFFVEGAGDENIGCGEGSAVRWTDEDGFYHRHTNAECKVTRSINFSGKSGETRPNNMAVLFYMKIQ